jgi:hypothetical protein
MCKGYRREAGSEGSAKQRCEPMDKNRIRGASVGQAGSVSRSPYPSTARSVDLATRDGKRQTIQYSLALEPGDQGETPVSGRQGAEPLAPRPAPENPASTEQLMEEVCDRGNLVRAWKRVRQNEGSPGVDGMTIDDARDYLRENWPNIRSQLLEGTYQPQPVKRIEIPKPDGGIRKLGVPCVVDRLIQQALLQVLQKRSDPTFPSTVTASDRDAPPIRPLPKRDNTLPRATAS